MLNLIPPFFPDDFYTCTLPQDSGECDNKIFRYYYNAIEVKGFADINKHTIAISYSFSDDASYLCTEDVRAMPTTS